MAKKATRTKKHPAEILDDNGTLIAAPGPVPGAIGQGAGEGEARAEADERDSPKAP